MSEQVKNVSEVAREIADVNAKAKEVAADLKTNLSAVSEALDVAKDVSLALRNAGAELRGILGIHSNNPPPDGK